MKKYFFFLLLLILTIHSLQSQQALPDSFRISLQSAKDDITKINLYYKIANTYAFSNQETAIEYAKTGLDLAKRIGYERGKARGLFILSFALIGLGDYTDALKCGFEFLSFAKKLNDTTMMVQANEVLAICYRDQENYPEALRHEYVAVALSKNSDVPSETRAYSLGTLSSIHEKMNGLDSALGYGLESLKLIKNWSGIYLKLGSIYTKLGQNNTALNFFHQGIVIAKQELYFIDLVDIYNKMSELFESVGNRDSSIFYAKKAINQEGVLTYPDGRLQAVTNLANLYESRREKDSTITYLKETIVLRKKIFDRQKTREAQALTFNEQILQQELAARRQQEKNKIAMYALLSVIIVFLLIALIQWRYNKQKQKTNLTLQRALTDLKATQSQLIQSEKMASLGELTAGIAHEIQNPLNFVNNFSEVNSELLEELKEEIRKQNYVEAGNLTEDIKANENLINLHGKRADGIVKSMLQHSHNHSRKKDLTDINKVADEYLRIAYHACLSGRQGQKGKENSFNVTLRTDFDPAIGKIDVIPQDIGSVLLNLYNNAFYSVNEKLKSGNENYEPIVAVSTIKIKDKVQIKVTDNGGGIPQKILDKIFQPFFTTKPTGQGTGLGLSLAYDIVKAHGGELKVKSIEGRGSEFIILLHANS